MMDLCGSGRDRVSGIELGKVGSEGKFEACSAVTVIPGQTTRVPISRNSLALFLSLSSERI